MPPLDLGLSSPGWRSGPWQPGAKDQEDGEAVVNIGRFPSRSLLRPVGQSRPQADQKLTPALVTTAAALWHSEEIRMRAGAHRVQVISDDLVDQQPIRLDMAIPAMRPVASEGVIFVSCRQRVARSQRHDCLAQFGHVVAALPGELHVAPELSQGDRVAYEVSDPQVLP